MDDSSRGISAVATAWFHAGGGSHDFTGHMRLLQPTTPHEPALEEAQALDRHASAQGDWFEHFRFPLVGARVSVQAGAGFRSKFYDPAVGCTVYLPPATDRRPWPEGLRPVAFEVALLDSRGTYGLSPRAAAHAWGLPEGVLDGLSRQAVGTDGPLLFVPKAVVQALLDALHRREAELQAPRAAAVIQSRFRGWRFRLRHLYNPHTALGRAYALRQFGALLTAAASDPSPSEHAAGEAFSLDVLERIWAACDFATGFAMFKAIKALRGVPGVLRAYDAWVMDAPVDDGGKIGDALVELANTWPRPARLRRVRLRVQNRRNFGPCGEFVTRVIQTYRDMLAQHVRLHPLFAGVQLLELDLNPWLDGKATDAFIGWFGGVTDLRIVMAPVLQHWCDMTSFYDLHLPLSTVLGERLQHLTLTDVVRTVVDDDDSLTCRWPCLRTLHLEARCHPGVLAQLNAASSPVLERVSGSYTVAHKAGSRTARLQVRRDLDQLAELQTRAAAVATTLRLGVHAYNCAPQMQRFPCGAEYAAYMAHGLCDHAALVHVDPAMVRALPPNVRRISLILDDKAALYDDYGVEMARALRARAPFADAVRVGPSVVRETVQGFAELVRGAGLAVEVVEDEFQFWAHV